MENTKYLNRRQNLGSKFSRTLFIVPSGSLRMRSHSVAHRFKTASDFLYLCGVHVSEACLLIAGSKSYFLSDSIEATALWEDVNILMDDDRLKLAGMELRPFYQLKEIISDHMKEFDRVAFPIGSNEALDRLVLEQVSFTNRSRRRFTSTPLALCDSRMLIGQLRHVKEADEICLMKEAAQRTSRVYRKLFQECLEGRQERDVADFLESEFMKAGMSWTAYETIVGSGDRATTLHARATSRVLRSGEAVLIDAAGEWQGYCADITRVIPVDAVFGKMHRQVYDIVLNAQEQTINAVRPGITLRYLHEMSQELLLEGLSRYRIGGDIKELMPHGTSHWIGMDVHDPSAYVDEAGRPLQLQEGMSFTIEPGLYFREKTSAYYGIGVRIEDDVVVTGEGCEVLSSAPKQLEEIESLRSQLNKNLDRH
ncbi:MAG: hypothetical protein OM95_06220 [Bdellovibrio sp. ArHS]|uniref:aminopeptidase P N-terminal domain-containing protein n=1 Tax=Bdellovibrio sp. ArHS TaxID=1569284 RepID=UPI00058350B0|nr:aminopeptidase P N-terminal domain-containing protein [Bdellovibrio sp. ArHS]KHD89040.1 MAG: hypothetical protein OM95_06220 [Bdellovibrio sp. ArHS]